MRGDYPRVVVECLLQPVGSYETATPAASDLRRGADYLMAGLGQVVAGRCPIGRTQAGWGWRVRMPSSSAGPAGTAPGIRSRAYAL